MSHTRHALLALVAVVVFTVPSIAADPAPPICIKHEILPPGFILNTDTYDVEYGGFSLGSPIPFVDRAGREYVIGIPGYGTDENGDSGLGTHRYEVVPRPNDHCKIMVP